MSDLLEALRKGVTLRKVSASEKPVSNASECLCSDESDYQRLMRDTFLEDIYAVIKPFSFETDWISLSSANLQSIVDAHKIYKETGQIRLDEHLQKLIEQIDACKERNGWESVFVRLSTSSAKDAALARSEFADMYRAALLNIAADLEVPSGEWKPDLNSRLHALYIAGTAAMRIQHGSEAVHMLIVSDRIQDDVPWVLQAALEREAAGSVQSALSLAVRRFHNFDVSGELRGFIHKGKLTALTQYNHLVYFPTLCRRRAAVQAAAVRFCETLLIPRLPPSLQSCVVDLILIPKQQGAPAVAPAAAATDATPETEDVGYDVRVVELNPLAEFAGTGLFSWSGADRQVLLGERPFEFRVLEQAPVVRRSDVAPAWGDLAFREVTVTVPAQGTAS